MSSGSEGEECYDLATWLFSAAIKNVSEEFSSPLATFYIHPLFTV